MSPICDLSVPTTASVLAPSWRNTGMYTCRRPLTRTTFVWMKLASRGVATSRRNAVLPSSVRSGIPPISLTASNIEFESSA